MVSSKSNRMDTSVPQAQSGATAAPIGTGTPPRPAVRRRRPTPEAQPDQAVAAIAASSPEAQALKGLAITGATAAYLDTVTVPKDALELTKNTKALNT